MLARLSVPALPLSLRGSWRPFLLSFNLTFPANGQPGVNSTALIATRQSPAVSVCERPGERARGGERSHPPRLLSLPGSLSPKERGAPPSFSSRLLRSRGSTRFLGYILVLGCLSRLSHEKHDENAYFPIEVLHIVIRIRLHQYYVYVSNEFKYLICELSYFLLSLPLFANLVTYLAFYFRINASLYNIGTLIKT